MAELRLNYRRGFCGVAILLLALSSLLLFVGCQEVKQLRRDKRQLSLSCPSEPARGSGGGQVKVIFYSPKKRADVTLVYSGKNWDGASKTLASNGFNKTQPTLVYLHAYQQNARSKWLQTVRSQYDDQKQATFNLLFVDWSDYSQRQYSAAVSYVPYLGEVVGEMLEELRDSLSYNLTSVHLVSYSLSTHIAGLAARQVGPKVVGQITALDPTGVCMHEQSSFASKYSLKPTDAKLVVARHYDMKSLGAKRAIGGVDIFINGGRNQPGAGGGNRLAALTSSHSRATEHENQEADEKCYEVAYRCKSYATFLAGECGSCGRNEDKCFYIHTIDKMLDDGLNNSTDYKTGTKMYLKTSSSEPFCLYHYQVIVQLKSSTPTSTKESFKEGKVKLTFSSGVQIRPTNEAETNRFTALITSSKKINNKKGVSVTVNSSDSGQLNKNIEYVQLNFMSNPDSGERAKASAKYCWSDKTQTLDLCSL